MTKKYVDGVLRDMTTQEQALHDVEVLEWNNTEFERKIMALRLKRNSLLAKTDWTALSDNTMSDAMKTYRQQLRDATEGLDTVEKIQAYEFPTEVLK
jgi:hypothetical protein